MQNRFKSPVLWTAIISAIILVARALGWLNIDDTTISNIVTFILTALVAVGIVNNPVNKGSI